MSRTVADWLDGVRESYGDLANFPDAPTVRTMRRFAQDYLDEHTRIVAQIRNKKGRQDYDDFFADEVAAAKAQVEALDKWLADRGLTL